LKAEFGAAAVELHPAQLIDAEHIHATAAGDGARLVIGGLDELVHQPGRESVLAPEPLLGGRGAEPDQEVALAGAGIADQPEGLTAANPVAGGEGADGGGVDAEVGVEVEVA
jgi:hypothetical protein